MPYVGTQRVLDLLSRKILPDKVGDLCSIAFYFMVLKWLANPSWTTWSKIRLEGRNGTWKKVYLDSCKETWNHLFTDEEAQNQVEAALEVFYDRYVSKYEQEKFEQNGGVIDKEN